MELPANKPVVCPTIVGRATELAALHVIVREVEEGQSRIVLLSGEAGIGKSRLVAEVETEADSKDFLVLQGNCFQRDLNSPYAPLLDLMRLYIANQPPEVREAELQPFAHELLAVLPDLITPAPDSVVLPTSGPEQEKRRLFVALTTILTKQAAGRPLLLVIEDIHWCDESSLEFLQHFMRHSTSFPWLILLTYRSDEVHPALTNWLAQQDRERRAQEFSLARFSKKMLMRC